MKKAKVAAEAMDSNGELELVVTAIDKRTRDEVWKCYLENVWSIWVIDYQQNDSCVVDTSKFGDQYTS